MAQHATLSDGTAPISFLPAETRARLTKRAKMLQRLLARAARSSKRRRRKRIAKASLASRLAAVRRSALHRVTTDLTNIYGLIAIENLRVSNMRRLPTGVIVDKLGKSRSIRKRHAPVHWINVAK